jgi:D-beta-D-heptose 7-phosphate kinase/D-beta-D-heptose 1-phosphate adenosyltransferase
MNYVLFTGGFDPIHSGHIAAMKQASQIGNLIVAPNSDEWLTRKKGAAFQPLSERSEIIRNFSFVHEVLTAWDDTDGTACKAIELFHHTYSRKGLLFFANGGDRTPTNVSSAEIELCAKLGVLPVFNVGGGKTQSSSAFIQDWMRRV